ncbi:MAG TPA: hypothetical protein PKU80_00310 [Candidatus Limiplasma sp.]|nr:hypothetical protein [Candidatus Limiplasma sp.]HRX09786.1 hypothetical protein [Candidatus Limiplasma sp.]
MRKWLIGIVLALSLIFISAAAQAQTYVLDSLMATVDIPETYVVITPDNIATYAEWLSGQGVTSEETVNDMLKRGVLLQAWDQEVTDRRFELIATQSEDTLLVFDVNEQTSDYRGTYRTSFYPDNEYTSQGYTFSTSNWKHTDSGRFLILEYIMRKYGEIDHRGYMRRTIRNGYEITFDMQVYGRKPNSKDNYALNKIWDSFEFVTVMPLPAKAQAQINIAQPPPQETNAASFTISGTAAKGVKFTTVTMGMNYSDKILNTVELTKSGSFKIPIELPREGVFLTTLEAEYNGEVVAEIIFPSTTYSRTLLAVNIDTQVPENVGSDSLTILGSAEPRAEIQVFVNDEAVDTKKVATDGRFSVEISTKDEGIYEVLLVFSKKGLADRRIPITFSRNWTAEDMISRIKADAVTPSYDTLVQDIARYDGRTIVYKSYLLEVVQSGSDWIYKMALRKSGSTYSDFILVIASEEPAYEIGSRLMMYGKSVGMSVSGDEGQSAGGEAASTESYPYFELLLLTAIE